MLAATLSAAAHGLPGQQPRPARSSCLLLGAAVPALFADWGAILLRCYRNTYTPLLLLLLLPDDCRPLIATAVLPSVIANIRRL
jgi:hypothetical protein